MGINSNIRKLRKRAGLTQEELAEKLEVARSTITQWETGWSSPRMGMIQKLSGVFGVTPAGFCSKKGNHMPPHQTPSPSRRRPRPCRCSPWAASTRAS